MGLQGDRIRGGMRLCRPPPARTRSLDRRSHGSCFGSRSLESAPHADAILTHNQDCCDEIKEPVDLARAIRLVKLEFTIYTKDLDPLLYVERALVHLQNVFRSDNPTYHVGNATKPFGVKNKKWIKGLSLERARTLAISLLSFSREICLAHGRSPEQVASAAVVVALEAIARKPCPKQEELDQELAWVTNTASFTIAERYREYSKALTTYAPQVPWIANSAKKWTKKQVVEHTTDIVQYWQARHGKDRKERERKWELDRDNAQNANGSGHKGGEEEAKEDDDDLERAGSIDTDEDAEVAEDESEFPPKLAFLDPLGTQTDIYRFARGPDQTSEIDRKAGYDKNAGHVLRRPGIFVRGSAEWTRHRAALDALSKGLGPSPSPSPFDAASPAPSTSSTRLDSPPLISDASLAALDPVSYAALATYGQKPDATRAQLAPTGSAAAKKKAKAAETRLSRLLWEKTAEEIEDAELFDDGELDSYVRTDDEANAIRQLPRYTQMLRDAAEQELKPKHPRRPPRRARGQPNPEYIALQAEAAAKGITVNRILTAREKRARGEESDGDDVPSSSTQPGFRRPRQKKTKVNAEAKARLLAALAKGSDDEDEAGEEGEGGSGGGWIGAAIDAAGQVDPAVAELAQPDEGDDDDEVYEGDDYWKKDFRLAEVDSDGYEDE